MRHLTRLTIAAAAYIAVGCGDAPTSPRRSPPPDYERSGVPSAFTASPVSSTEIDLSWQMASTGVNGLELFRSTTGTTGSFTRIATLAASTTSYADVGLSSTTSYCYKLRSFTTIAKSTKYSAYSAVVCATPPAPAISAPSEVDARPSSSTVIRVTWKDNSTNEDGFRVERNVLSEGWRQLTTTPAGNTAIVDSVTAEVTVCYRVTAFGAAGLSMTSDPDCTTAPKAPTMLTPQADLQTITVRWIDNSVVEDGYAVFRLNAAGVWSVLATVSANSNSYRDGAVSAGVTYRYQVRAVKDSGYSDSSRTAEGSIPTTTPAPPVVGAGYTYGGLSAPFPQMVVSWWDTSATLVDGYLVQDSAASSARWADPVRLTAPQNALYSWASTEITCWRVIAFNAAGNSPPSAASCAELPSAPTNVSATAVDQHTIDLTWTDNTALELGFIVLRSSPQHDQDEFIYLPPNATSYRDTALTAATEYSYIIAVDYGWGIDELPPTTLSDYASATTLSDSPATSAPIVAPLRVFRTPSGGPKVTINGRLFVRRPSLPQQRHRSGSIERIPPTLGIPARQAGRGTEAPKKPGSSALRAPAQSPH